MNPTFNPPTKFSWWSAVVLSVLGVASAAALHPWMATALFAAAVAWMLVATKVRGL